MNKVQSQFIEVKLQECVSLMPDNLYDTLHDSFGNPKTSNKVITIPSELDLFNGNAQFVIGECDASAVFEMKLNK